MCLDLLSFSVSLWSNPDISLRKHGTWWATSSRMRWGVIVLIPGSGQGGYPVIW